MDMVDDIIKFYDDPYGYVMYAFPWGEPGTPLEHEVGPDEWQKNHLNTIRDQIRLREAQGESVDLKELDPAIQIATTAGHGVGKSAESAWVIHWFIATRPHPQIVVTANTRSQLITKTWRELAVWNNLAINKDWFEWTATRFYFKEHPSTWFAAAIPWSKNNPEAFQGTHAKYVLVLFDEASGIDDVIWGAVEGAMTTTGSMWLAYSNPTKTTGRFHSCFHRDRHRWIPFKVDGRNAKMTNKVKLEHWIEDHGIDSDWVRVKVLGEFPRASSTQFISSAVVEACQNYEASHFDKMPYIMGVDVARFGDDQSVILVRQGRKTHFIQKYRNLDTVQLSHRISEFSSSYPKMPIFIDGVGVGAGVVDVCRSWGMKVTEVNAGCAADDAARYANKRAEMWGHMREWLKEGAEIPKDDELFTDLTSVEYGYTNKGQILLEKKEDMKSRGLASPDAADALALTFAAPISASTFNVGKPMVAKMDWNVF